MDDGASYVMGLWVPHNAIPGETDVTPPLTTSSGPWALNTPPDQYSKHQATANHSRIVRHLPWNHWGLTGSQRDGENQNPRYCARRISTRLRSCRMSSLLDSLARHVDEGRYSYQLRHTADGRRGLSTDRRRDGRAITKLLRWNRERRDTSEKEPKQETQSNQSRQTARKVGTAEHLKTACAGETIGWKLHGGEV